jgi:hypothetical protein
MVKMPKIIAVSGIAQSGKDTFCNAIASQISGAKRFALADLLKEEIRPILIDRHQIDIFNCTPEQKETVRPDMVEYGKAKRRESQNRYWIDKLIPKIQEYLRANENNIALISDVRYFESDNDECPWVKYENNGILVHVSKYKIINGRRVFTQPPNDDEKRNDPILSQHANYRIVWQEQNSNNFRLNNNDDYLFRQLDDHIQEFIKWLKR